MTRDPSAAATRAAILDRLRVSACRAPQLVGVLGIGRARVRAHLDDLIEEGEVERCATWYRIPEPGRPEGVPANPKAHAKPGNQPTPEQLFLTRMLRGHVPKACEVPEALLLARAVVVEEGVARLTKDGRELALRVPGVRLA